MNMFYDDEDRPKRTKPPTDGGLLSITPETAPEDTEYGGAGAEGLTIPGWEPGMLSGQLAASPEEMFSGGPEAPAPPPGGEMDLQSLLGSLGGVGMEEENGEPPAPPMPMPEQGGVGLPLPPRPDLPPPALPPPTVPGEEAEGSSPYTPPQYNPEELASLISGKF